ncbi:MAG: cation:proton antiporter [Bacteroidales bacterium]|nr:cation:proton antiporter [Bacteroidales bacterium]
MQEMPLITTIAAGFTAAWVLGLLTQWLRLSPIVGYLLGGVIIGPHSPGFHGDMHLAHELAEVGVILLMFGVGLHFHLGDLLAVKSIAIPGALGQSAGATLASIAVFSLYGISVHSGAVIGMALSVASTVVLMRVLMDADALNSPAGHAAVGWLLVEDVLTVILLVMIPVLGTLGVDALLPISAVAGGAAAIVASFEPTGDNPWLSGPVVAIGVALLKLAALIGIVMIAGSRLVPWVLTQVARLRSRELFTLTVMVFSIAIAAGAYFLFGASMALGAFLAGMMVARSPVSHQAAADALPLRDAFAVLFFVSVGMLFDPRTLLDEPLKMFAVLAIILLVKPIIALFIVMVLGHSVRTALTVALGLSQIGEFSFIVASLAEKHGLMSTSDHSLIVGAAIITITLNPILFLMLDSIEDALKRNPRLWARLNARAERKVAGVNDAVAAQVEAHADAKKRLAVVVGYGPVGRTVERLLRDAGLLTVVIDMNMDTVADLRRQGREAVFGDASREAILESAGVGHASHLIVTLPHTADRAAIVSAARGMNPKMKTFVRAHYLREREELEFVGATAAIFEEAEAAVSLARLVLADTGAGRESIERSIRDIRARLILDNVTTLRSLPIRNIMVPWTRVRRLSTTFTLDEVRRQVGEQRFSRWPVVDAQTQFPIGYLLAKDLIGLPPNDTGWLGLVRPLGTIHPNADVQSILQYFQREGATIGLAEDGGTPIGIVTIEDILEQVVGRIEDEYPRHPRTELHELLIVDDTLLNLAGQTAEQAIAEMASRIPASRCPWGVDIAGLAIAREREFQTTLGHGIAVPHARCPGLSRSLVVLGRSHTGINFDATSSEPVQLVFLLVTPTDQPTAQVHLLAQVAKIVGDADKRQRLLVATSATEIAAILAE